MIENEEKLVNLLKEAEKFEIGYNVKKQNFLSITNFPRYENVISDILAFYFHTEEEHKLKDLWLNCLLECYNDKSVKKINYNDLNVDRIIREQSTDERKRIDLFIVTDENIVIIENKIDSPLNNDLGKYYKKAKEYYHEHFDVMNDDEMESHITPILLTMKKETEFNDKKFINIIYEDLIKKIKQKMGSYIDEASTKWLIYMKEFINNLEEINRGYQMSDINIDFQQFLKNNEEELKHFLNDVLKKDINSKIDFIKEVYKKIKTTINQKIEIGTYNCYYDRLNGYFSLYINIKTQNGTIAIEPYVSREIPDIIKFTIWKRKVPSYSWNNELDVLKKSYKACKEDTDGSWGKVLRVGEYRFSSGDIEVEKFANEIIEVFEKLMKLYEIK